MEKASIKIDAFEYEDNLPCLMITASNGRMGGQLEWYAYLDELKNFGTTLEKFVGIGERRAEPFVIERGGKEGWAYHLKISVSTKNGRYGILFEAEDFQIHQESCRFEMWADAWDVIRLAKLFISVGTKGAGTYTWTVPAEPAE